MRNYNLAGYPMKFATFALILTSVCMSAFAQILLKTGLNSNGPIGNDGVAATLFRMLFNPWVLAGLGLYFIGAIIWLFALAQSEVSYAYPFVSLGFIVTMILGYSILGEHVGAPRIVGTVLIVTGIAFVARS